MFQFLYLFNYVFELNSLNKNAVIIVLHLITRQAKRQANMAGYQFIQYEHVWIQEKLITLARAASGTFPPTLIKDIKHQLFK